MAKILLVEDYIPMCEAIEDWLSHETHTVETVNTGTEALDRMRVYKYDLIILDWMIPGMSGLDVCKEYRSRGGTTPILMMTGKGSVDDKETGLDTGADDYLVKPVDFKELSARVRALLRRASAQSSNVLSAGPLEIDLRTHRVLRDGHEIHLTPTELSLLEFFMRNPNQPFTAEALLERVWRSDAMTSLDTVRSYIRMLRKKIDDGRERSLISTVHGAGYRLDVDRR